MTLQASELIQTYHYLHQIFPEDVHLARPLVQHYQKEGDVQKAYAIAEDVGRRMFSLGKISVAQGFLRLCLQLKPEGDQDIASMLAMADVMDDAASDTDASTFALIEKLSDQEAGKFIRQAELLTCAKDAVLIRQGDMDSRFYVILEGAMGVHLKLGVDRDLHIKTLLPGDYFGEYACIYQLPRTATVIAEEDSLLLAFSDEVVGALMELSPEAGDVLMKIVAERLIQSMTHIHPAFLDVVDGDHHWVAEESYIVDLQEGAVLNAQSGAAHLILYGSLIVEQDGVELKKLSVNAMFGDLHQHLCLPDGASVRANQRTLLCVVPREIFDSLMRAYGSFERWVDGHSI